MPLIHDQEPARFFHGRDDRLRIHRNQGPQVDHFHIHSLFGQGLSRLQRFGHHVGGADNRQSVAFANHMGLSQRDQNFACRDQEFLVVFDLVFQKDNGVVIADGGFQQPLQFGGRRTA